MNSDAKRLGVVLASLIAAVMPCAAFGPGSVDPPEWGPDTITVTPENLEARRAALIDYIWGDEGWPTNRALYSAQIHIAYTNISWMGVLTNASQTNLSSVDMLQYRMPASPGTGWLTTYVLRLRPTTSNGKLFIYHGGHSSGPISEETWGEIMGWPLTMTALVNAGYEVLAFGMPLMNGNPPPTFTRPDLTTYVVSTHDVMFAELDHPLRYFFEQIPSVLDYLEAQGNVYSRIHMMGLSGGGWTTVIYSAMDPRIEMSFPVAGSLPLWLRVGYEGLGDGEQVDPGLYTVANYSELYAMGGANGYQLQLNNLTDPCCFYGNRQTNYVDAVKAAAVDLGGWWSYYQDPTNPDHKVSQKILNMILQKSALGPVWAQNDPVRIYRARLRGIIARPGS